MNRRLAVGRAAVLTLATTAAVLPCAAQTPVAPEADAKAFAPGQTTLFTLQFPADLDGAYTGRVYVVLGGEGDKAPRKVMFDWFNPRQVLAQDAADVAPGGTVGIGADAAGFPRDAGQIPAGEYIVQAVARVDPDHHTPGQGRGDLYSKSRRITLPASEPVRLAFTERVEPPAFAQTDRIRLFEMPSPALSAFHGRPVTMRAGVVLPEGWKENDGRTWPTVYFIHGFGGDHNGAHQLGWLLGPRASECIVVIPDPSVRTGHSVFADSANNGPRGEALVRELIPAVEARFGGAGEGSRRYVTGISSGGWSSLWLQITYPTEFAGVWSHVPDPVDFRDFQRVDLYAPGANMYADPQERRRPLARDGDRVLLWYDDFVRREGVQGEGGQISSFEAVFSPRGSDGRPLPMFDRDTGEVDPQVARAWEAYDIRLILERNWDRLGPLLAGKIHVYAGEKDNFYLEGAARLLGESLKALGSDAVVEVVPNMGHAMHAPGVQDMFDTIAERQQQQPRAQPLSPATTPAP